MKIKDYSLITYQPCLCCGLPILIGLYCSGICRDVARAEELAAKEGLKVENAS